MPSIYKDLKKILLRLEKHYRDMQDVEFTVENKKLWMLQTRSGKRTAKSAIKIATDMVKEKLISKKEAVLRIEPNSLDSLLHPTLDEKSNVEVIAKGLPASPGAASGKVVFSSDEARKPIAYFFWNSFFVLEGPINSSIFDFFWDIKFFIEPNFFNNNWVLLLI